MQAVANGDDTNAKLSKTLGVHVNVVGAYAKRLAAEGFITSDRVREKVGDQRFKDANRVDVRHYAVTDKGREELQCSS